MGRGAGARDGWARRRLGRQLRFFFQAEDGIRDVAVTGVQTCALPIWLPNQPKCSRLLEVRFELFSDTAKPVQSRSSDREIRQGLAGPTHLAKQHREIGRASCRERV